ncbi:MAG: phosphatidylinositol-specific phospholipase C domain-containing protein [Clostridia bacterium]|nr:phosphatidylinositol-specific phospholipase C domain-containing protein [Clostridia bacterium]
MGQKGLKGVLVTLAVLFVIFFVLGIVLGAANGVAATINDDSLPCEELSSWMQYINDDTLITDIVIPGSHDSGTYTMAWHSETQSREIKDQLLCGTRYFDIRIGLVKGELRVFHGPTNGLPGEPVIEDIAAFLDNNPSEFLILDFQHFKGGSEEKVIALLEEKLAGKMVDNTAGIDELTFIKTLKLKDVRGKALIYWGVEDKQREKTYVFSRNNDEGTRAGSTLNSYYFSAENGKPSEKYISTSIPKYIDMAKNSDGGLFVLQCQLTDAIIIMGPKYREAQNEKNMNEFIESLNTSEDLKHINIVMRDYVSPSKTGITLKLNLSKGIVKDMDKYTAILNNLTR